MFVTPNGDVIAGGAVVGGIVLILQVLKPYILPKAAPVAHSNGNGVEAKIKVLETKVDNCEEEIRGLRKRCHDLGNFISELQGRLGRIERR